MLPIRSAGMISFKGICSLLSSVHQSWSSTNSWPCGYFACVSLGKVGVKNPVHPQLTVKLLKMECPVSHWTWHFFCCSISVLFLSTCWAQQTLSVEWQWVYNCTCHISVIVQALYVAVLRIVQLAFSIKPCPPTEIRPTSQTSLYNH